MSHITNRMNWTGAPRVGRAAITYATPPVTTPLAIGRPVFSFPGRAQSSPFVETPRSAVPRLRFGPSALQSRGLIRDLSRGIAARDDIAGRLDVHRGRPSKGTV
jgi:hypothetical protein